MSTLNQNIEYCCTILPQVSRTFAPTIRMLPGSLNLTVMVAYLLCRIADTVEDEKCLTKREKQELYGSICFEIVIWRGKEYENLGCCIKWNNTGRRNFTCSYW